MMDHYERDKTAVNEGALAMHQFQPEEGETVEIPENHEEKLFSGLSLDLTGVTIMRVKNGSKVRNLLGFALKKIKEDGTKHVIFTGSASAIGKTITCVEIIKRNMKSLHQVSKIYHKRIAELWNPKELEEGLDRLKVTRHIPAVAILLSKEPLDASEPGYQGPGTSSKLWTESGSKKDTKKSQPRKRTNAEKASSWTGRTAQTSGTPEPKDGRASVKKKQKKRKAGAQPKKGASGQ